MIRIIKKTTITLLAFLMCFTSAHWNVFAEDLCYVTIKDGENQLEVTKVYKGTEISPGLRYKGDILFSAGFAFSQEEADNGNISLGPNDSIVINSNTELYVIWANGYTTDYVINGDTENIYTRNNANTYDYNINPDGFDGYRLFYYTDPEYQNLFDWDTDAYDGMTIYVKRLQGYKVSYVYEEMLIGEYTVYSVEELDKSFEELGYYPDGNIHLLYWSETPNGSRYDGGLKDNLTLYAVTAEGYTAEYYDYYGNYLGNRIITDGNWNIDISEFDYQLPDKYLFLGWAEWEQADCWNLYTGDCYENMQLYAVIVPYVLVTFCDENGAVLAEKPVYKNIDNIDISDITDNAYKEGYEFAGWTLTLGGDDYYRDYPEEGLVLYAKYLKQYKVTYWLDENTVLARRTVLENYWCSYNITDFQEYVPQENGLVFYYWSREIGGEPFYEGVTENIDLYAVFGEGCYINYHDSEGTLLGTILTSSYWWRDISPWSFEGYQLPNDVGYKGWSIELGSKQQYQGEIYDYLDVYMIITHYYHAYYYDGDNYLTERFCEEDDFYINPYDYGFALNDNGMRFAYWSDNENDTEFKGPLTGDTNLHAVYGIGVITYYDHHGELLGRKGIISGNEWDVPQEYFYNFYLTSNQIFIGWSKEGSYGRVYSGEAYDGLELWAVVQTAYTVTYYRNGVIIGTIQYNEGDWADVDISYFDYTVEEEKAFLYWGDENLNPVENFYVYNDMKLYAVFGDGI